MSWSLNSEYWYAAREEEQREARSRGGGGRVGEGDAWPGRRAREGVWEQVSRQGSVIGYRWVCDRVLVYKDRL